MHRPRSTPRSAQRLVRLLVLLLCLPLGQLCAQWHLLSHVALQRVAAAAAAEPDASVQPSACELCLDALAVSAGAQGVADRAVAPAQGVDIEPARAPASAIAARRVVAYRSRAPPLAAS